jgi:hypothetical protein
MSRIVIVIFAYQLSSFYMRTNREAWCSFATAPYRRARNKTIRVFLEDRVTVIYRVGWCSDKAETLASNPDRDTICTDCGLS